MKDFAKAEGQQPKVLWRDPWFDPQLETLPWACLELPLRPVQYVLPRSRGWYGGTVPSGAMDALIPEAEVGMLFQ